MKPITLFFLAALSASAGPYFLPGHAYSIQGVPQDAGWYMYSLTLAPSWPGGQVTNQQIFDALGPTPPASAYFNGPLTVGTYADQHDFTPFCCGNFFFGYTPPSSIPAQGLPQFAFIFTRDPNLMLFENGQTLAWPSGRPDFHKSTDLAPPGIPESPAVIMLGGWLLFLLGIWWFHRRAEIGYSL